MSNSTVGSKIVYWGIKGINVGAWAWNEMYRNYTRPKQSSTQKNSPTKVISNEKGSSSQFNFIPTSEKVDTLVLDSKAVEKGVYEANQEQLIDAVNELENCKAEITSIREQIRQQELELSKKISAKDAISSKLEENMCKEVHVVGKEIIAEFEEESEFFTSNPEFKKLSDVINSLSLGIESLKKVNRLL